MAQLSNETLTTIFNLLKKLAQGIEKASAIEWEILERYGETNSTIIELDELQNVRERLRSRYQGLNRILIGVLEIQPTASETLLNLLLQTIEQAQADIDASLASIQEVKNNWNI